MSIFRSIFYRTIRTTDKPRVNGNILTIGSGYESSYYELSLEQRRVLSDLDIIICLENDSLKIFIEKNNKLVIIKNGSIIY